MKSENKKFRVTRELKVRVPADTLKRIKRVSDKYGMRQVLADASGIRNEYIPIILKTKLATKAMIEKLIAGVEVLEKQQAA